MLDETFREVEPERLSRRSVNLPERTIGVTPSEVARRTGMKILTRTPAAVRLTVPRGHAFMDVLDVTPTHEEPYRVDLPSTIHHHRDAKCAPEPRSSVLALRHRRRATNLDAPGTSGTWIHSPGVLVTTSSERSVLSAEPKTRVIIERLVTTDIIFFLSLKRF